MNDDHPGRRAVRGPRPFTPASEAGPEPTPEPSNLKARKVSNRRGHLEMPADLEIEESLEIQLPGGGTVTVSPSQGVDPAMVAARLMVLRAVSEGRAGKKVRARGSLTVVSVPGPEWLATVSAQWQAQFRRGSDPADGEEELRRLRSRAWVVFSRDGSERTHVPERGNDVVADTAWKGRAVVGFSPSPDTLLPSHLTRSPDCRLAVLPLDSRMLRAVIGQVTGRTPTVTIPESVAAKMTPDILRFARRHRQSADTYLTRLVALVEAPVPAAGRPGPTLDGIHGMDEAVAWGRRWIRDLVEYRAGRIPWSAVDAAAVLHGVPGTGKTMFAEALARSAGVPLVSASFARWQASGNGYLGDCLKAMRATFADATRRAPCVLLIDEVDAIGTRQGDKGEHKDYWTSVVTCVLELLDGTEGRVGVLVLGTTNDPDALDPALVRSGRLDRMLEIRRPDPAALEGILRHHLGTDLADVDVKPAARLALGGNGADCARWVRTARQSARQEGRPLTPADLTAAIGTTTFLPEVERMVATHEAGHAVATAVIRPGAVTDARIGLGVGTPGAVPITPDARSTREAVHGTLPRAAGGTGGRGGPAGRLLRRQRRLPRQRSRDGHLPGGGAGDCLGLGDVRADVAWACPRPRRSARCWHSGPRLPLGCRLTWKRSMQRRWT